MPPRLFWLILGVFTEFGAKRGGRAPPPDPPLDPRLVFSYCLPRMVISYLHVVFEGPRMKLSMSLDLATAGLPVTLLIGPTVTECLQSFEKYKEGHLA